MKKTILVATTNPGKITEIKSIFPEYNILSLKDIPEKIEIVEDCDSFEGNAFKKACETAKITNKPCLADDSGISIDALNGWPGVRTARWMKGTDREKNLGILKKMEGIPKEKRTVHYTTAIAYATESNGFIETHTIDGYISNEIRGKNGFGFDEIFELEDGRTLAELSQEEKNAISSRKIALEKIKTKLL